MQRWCGVLAVCTVMTWGGGVRAQDDAFVITDPRAPQDVDYLVISGDAFIPALAPLLQWRAGHGLHPGVVPMSRLRAAFDDVAACVRHACDTWPRPPRFLLLVGDVEQVPAVVRPGEFTQPPGARDLATDFDYACPHTPLQPELDVGRFPCDTPAECAAMVRKTVGYEADDTPGAWQHRVAFVTGEAGFSPQLDRMIEQLFITIVAPGIPDPYAVELAYANPRSPFCPDPARFNAHSLAMLNAGALFYVYVGHGYRNGVDRVRNGTQVYRILDTPDADRVDVRDGLPVMFVIACSTGQYDHPGDCVGEAFFKRPRGPVGFLGGSRVTQPYGNGLLGKALVDHCFTAETLGGAVTAAKVQLLAHAPSPLTQQADFMASMMQGGPEALPRMRRDSVRHYNLFGDPALRLRRPAMDLTVTLAGDTVTVRGTVPHVRLTLEVARGVFTQPMPAVDPAAPDAGAQLAERYRLANDPVWHAWEVPLTDGVGSVTLTRPARPGTYFLKARAPGHCGALRFEVKPPAPAGGEDF